jgi:hypothetical protein
MLLKKLAARQRTAHARTPAAVAPLRLSHPCCLAVHRHDAQSEDFVMLTGTRFLLPCYTGERGTRLTFSTYKAARLNHLNVKVKHLNIKIVDQEVLYLKHLSYTHASYAQSLCTLTLAARDPCLVNNPLTGMSELGHVLRFTRATVRMRTTYQPTRGRTLCTMTSTYLT